MNRGRGRGIGIDRDVARVVENLILRTEREDVIKEREKKREQEEGRKK